MKIKYFQDTDTLYIEFRTNAAVETKDLDEKGSRREHSERADLPHFSFEQVGP
jgi:hypothetical protein